MQYTPGLIICHLGQHIWGLVTCLFFRLMWVVPRMLAGVTGQGDDDEVGRLGSRAVLGGAESSRWW